MNIKNLFFIIIVFISFVSLSQNEANNWYFGINAGVKFNAGVPIAINDSEIFTYEGCSSYSDASGNILFYTDGITVWNRNNEAMPNGLGLGGNPSSTQSGLIVPNPDNSDIYYLFTVGIQGEVSGLPPNHGFKYYVVDMSLEGGLGDIVGTEVNLSNGLDLQWSEKVTSVQNTACDGFWVISLVESIFYSYLITSTGVSTIPVLSDLSSVIPQTDEFVDQDSRGYLKVSPGGNKLACAMYRSGLYLFDFNATTGVVSNGKKLELIDETEFSYGIEFSLNGRLLYVSTGNPGTQSGNGGNGAPNAVEASLYQFEITSANVNDINSSRNLIYTANSTSRGALQLASNGKIYWTSSGDPFLSVINNPDSTTNVDFDFQTVDLNGHNATEGLPPFLQSLFVANLDLINDGSGILATQLDLCHGVTYTIGSIDPSIPANALYEWSLDGVSLGLPNTTTSLLIDETGTYGAGFYELDVDYQDGSCEHRGIALVTFRDNPSLTPTTIAQCDIDADGFSLVDLNSSNESIVSPTPLTDQIFAFYTSFANASSQTSPLSDTFDITQFNTNNTTFWVRVENRYGCSAITQLNIDIQTPLISSFNRDIKVCDDFRDANGLDNENNDDTDGITFFNFEDPDNDGDPIDSIVTFIINQYLPINQPNLEVHFYHNEDDALLEKDEILNINNYRNIDSPFTEHIYIRVVDVTTASCPGFGPEITLKVIPIPQVLLAQDQREFNGCDDDNDGLFGFDTSQLETSILGGQGNVVLTYFYQDGTPINPMPDPFFTDTKTVVVKATNTTLNDCEVIFGINFIVDVLPVIENEDIQKISCDNGDNDQDGIASFDTSGLRTQILGDSNVQTNMIITYRDEFSNVLPSPFPDTFETRSQIISVDVENPNNDHCTTSTTIEFIVNDTPYYEVTDAIICLNSNPVEIRVPIEFAEDNYDYNWFKIVEGIDEVVGSNNNYLDVLETGEYKVTATTTDGNFCQKTKSFSVIESNEATLENIFTTDTTFSNSSSIIIQVSGEGDYEYALDIDLNNIDDDSAYQDSNTFNFIDFGFHTITIRDKNECGLITEDFVILEYQKFFTPNDDGDFETWNLTHVSNLFTTFNAVSNVTIYDRHGKIMAVIDPNGEGWNGKYKGKQAIATDYWFTVDLIDFNGKVTTKKGHFSLRL